MPPLDDTGRPGTAVPSTDRAAVPRPAPRIVRAWHAVRWYVHELMGDSAYDHYVARHHVDHPDHEPLTAAQWWRAKADAEASAPQTRCC